MRRSETIIISISDIVFSCASAASLQLSKNITDDMWKWNWCQATFSQPINTIPCIKCEHCKWHQTRTQTASDIDIWSFQGKLWLVWVWSQQQGDVYQPPSSFNDRLHTSGTDERNVALPESRCSWAAPGCMCCYSTEAHSHKQNSFFFSEGGLCLSLSLVQRGSSCFGIWLIVSSSLIWHSCFFR